MDQQTLETALADLHLPAIRYFSAVGSTNDTASAWAFEGAPDGALVVADEQTSGHGRGDRRWFTQPGMGLAFSLVMYPSRPSGAHVLPRLTALGAVAVRYALQRNYDIVPHIKWPNDVLINNHKVAGVLAEAQWSGEQIKSAVLGIGINVAAGAVSEKVLPRAEMNFPATSVEDALQRKVDRVELLHHVLKELLYWRPRIHTNDFLSEWESCLAFRGEWVQVTAGESYGKDGLPVSLEQMPQPVQEGKVLGLNMDGSLKLLQKSGEIVTVRVGEVRLGLPK
jgi:BirA family biotin operon repressor/biotin-[acetyl-CoA-carboxylase] ligase